MDATTRKIKVTHFQVVNLPPPEGNNNGHLLVGLDDESGGGSIDIPRNYTTAHIRIPHYTSHALDHIHFPTLRKLHLDFPLSRKRRVIGDNRKDFIEDVHTAAFPTFVTQLAYATNLKSLHLDINRLLQHEKGGVLESLYERFGENLAKCSNNLEELSIINTGCILGENHLKYSVAMADALIPTLSRRSGKLRVFSYKVVGKVYSERDGVFNLPRGPLIDLKRLHLRNKKVMSAAIQSAKLEKLHIECSVGRLMDFLRAATSCNDECEKKPSFINSLTVTCTPIVSRNYAPESWTNLPIGPMLDYFSECPLQEIGLGLPFDFWFGSDEPLEALKNLMTIKPKLSRVVINFMSSDDKDGEIVKWLTEIFRTKVNENGDMENFEFRVHNLLNFDREQLTNNFPGCVQVEHLNRISAIFRC